MSSGQHLLVFPYPASGHIIPLLDLTHKLLIRGFTISFLVTPKHLHLLQPLLSTHPPSSIQPLVLSPPDIVLVPTISGSLAYMRNLSNLRDPISQWFDSHHTPPVAIISDMLLGWTQDLASHFGVQRVVFWPSGALAAASFNFIWRELPQPDDPNDETSLVSLTEVPGCPKYRWWQMSYEHRYFEEGDLNWEFLREIMLANGDSWGHVFNSFTQLERVYLDHLKKEMGHDRVWAVGPILPSNDGLMSSTNRGGSTLIQTSELIDWLDLKGDSQVVYVCFGSRWTLMDKQVGALATALESSGVNFIWVLKEADLKHIPTNDFEERVKGRGILIKGWAPQVTILEHRAVGAFVTHCGWNSVLEGLSAGVLLLTWPLGAEQFINAKLLVDTLGVAVRLYDDGTRDVPETTELTRLLAESIDNCSPEVSDKVKEMRIAATQALEGGSSTRDMDIFVQKLYDLGN